LERKGVGWQRRRLFLVCVLMAFVACGCQRQEERPKRVSLSKRTTESLSSPASDLSHTLGFGFDLRLSPKEDVEIYLPFLRYLEEQTGLRFSLDFSANYRDTVENLGKGRTAFAALGPVNCILATERYGAGCLVMGVNASGTPRYRAVIITRADSPIHRLEELAGRSFAFGDRFSTQGHVIPRKMLEDVGIKLSDLSGHLFAGSHANAARAVMTGAYDAAGLQDVLARRLAATGSVRILAVSKPYPSSLICYSRNVPREQTELVRQALLSFDPMGTHSAGLKNWDKTEMAYGFTGVRPGDLEEIKELAGRYGLLAEPRAVAHSLDNKGLPAP